MAVVDLGANGILSARDRIVWQTFVVEPVAVRVRRLFVVGAIAFECPFVVIGIAWRRGVIGRHRDLLADSG